MEKRTKDKGSQHCKKMNNKITIFKDEDITPKELISSKSSKAKKRKSDKREESFIDSSYKEISLPTSLNSESTRNDDEAEIKEKNIKINKTKKVKRSKDEVNNIPTKSIKIKFTNNEPVQVKVRGEDFKKKKRLNDDEEEVKDEDIDAFCHQLNEKDNEVYENWVKLFEDNFRSNKKKT